MRLINADRLLTDRMKSKYYHLPNGDTAIPIIDIEHAPIIDAVEVVRCKDCKYWHSNTEFCDIWSFANIAQRTLAYDYCSRGERRGDSEA